MRKKDFLLFIIIIAFLCFACHSGSKFSQITSLDDADADGNVLIFFANWCGHCKAAKPEFEDAVQKSNGKIIMIDADDPASGTLRKKYSIQGFPSIIKISRNSYIKYNGDRTSDGILEFLNK